MKTRKKLILTVLIIVAFLTISGISCYIFHENKIKKYSTYCMDEVRNQLGEYVGNISNYYVDKTYGGFLVYSGNVSYEGVDYAYNCKVLNKDKVKLELQEVSGNISRKIEVSKEVKSLDSNVIYGGKGEHKITGDKTIYYSSGYGISLRIRADFSGGIILESDSEQHDIPTENRYNTHDIHFLKIEDPELGMYQGGFLITVLTNDQAEKRENTSAWNDGRENSIIGKNNKYTFIGLPSNSDSYTDLYIFDVKELGEGILAEKSIEKNVNINIEGEITESEEGFLPIIDSEANIYHLPTCNPVKVDETKPIIPIDDVVENCSYEEGFAWSWDSGGVGGVMPMVYIMKNVIGIPIRGIDASDGEGRHPEGICYTDDIGLVAKPTRENQNIFIEFLEKHKFRKSRLLLFASETTTAEMFKNTIFFCENEELCNQLWQPAWGENDKHYYVRGIRKDGEQEVLVVDGILYGLGKYKSIFENYYPSPLKESERNVYGLSGDKLIVKKYIDGELIPPYTMNNFKSYKFDKPTTTTKFKIKTCDISL